MNISLTDFLTGFSLALDLQNPANGQRGIRRAFIAMTILHQQGASLEIQQKVFIAALLYELGSIKGRDLSHCQKEFESIPLIAKSAPLIFEKSVERAHSRMLDLVDNVDLLALYEFPRGDYPASTIETVCDSIGSRYSLDDILSLREFEQYPEIWLKLASPNLLNDVRALSPLSSQTLYEDELVQLINFLSRIIDAHCLHPENYSAQVAEYSVYLAHMYGFSHSGVMEMRLAGLLHSLGKLALPEGTSVSESLEKFRDYPLKTREILFNIPGMYRTAIIASCQHEQLDGKGFPEALYGTQLDLSARIISAVCTYVSLRTGCNTDKKLSPFESIKKMKSKSSAGSLDLDIIYALEMIIAQESRTADCATYFNALQGTPA